MSPTLRALFTEKLPPSHTTYLIPSQNVDPDIDEAASKYLSDLIHLMEKTQSVSAVIICILSTLTIVEKPKYEHNPLFSGMEIDCM